MDKPTKASFEPFMKFLGEFLDCNSVWLPRLLAGGGESVWLPQGGGGVYNLKKNGEILSLEISAFDKVNKLIIYFNEFPLLGIKALWNDFKDWEKVFYMIFPALP